MRAVKGCFEPVQACANGAAQAGRSDALVEPPRGLSAGRLRSSCSAERAGTVGEATVIAARHRERNRDGHGPRVPDARTTVDAARREAVGSRRHADFDTIAVIACTADTFVIARADRLAAAGPGSAIARTGHHTHH